MIFHIEKDSESLTHYIADWLVEYIKDTIQLQNSCSIALSGGNTPKQLYILLTTDAYRNKIEWKKINFFFGDERYVPITDERNNAKMAFDTLLNHVPVKKENVHVMRTDIDADQSIQDYETILHTHFDNQPYTFDLVLLGLGDNAHTLSLFPGYSSVIFEKKQWVRSFYLEEQKTIRITLTAPIVNKSRAIAFIVTGTEKAEALAQVTEGEKDFINYPAQIILPENGQLFWFLDQAAAEGLQKNE